MCCCVDPLQGTGGLRLVSSARICELYSLADGSSEPSYAGSLRGTPHPQLPLPPVEDQPLPSHLSEAPQPAQGDPQAQGGQLWLVEHRWRAGQAPHTIVARLLSLADRDCLQLHSLQLLPAVEAALDGGASAAGRAAEEAGAGEAGAVPRPALAPAAAGTGSQLDEVRSMLTRLTAEEGGSSGSGGGSGAAPDPKRALMAAIAKSVLRQPPAQQRRPEPEQLLRQGSAAAEAAAPAAAQAAAEAAAAGAAAVAAGPGDPSQHPVAVALVGLQARVAGLEAVCGEMHGMLQQLLQARAGGGAGSGTAAK